MGLKREGFPLEKQGSAHLNAVQLGSGASVITNIFENSQLDCDYRLNTAGRACVDLLSVNLV